MIAWDDCVLWLGKWFDGDKWLDVSKQVNNGVFVGAKWREDAIYFDGVDNYINLGNPDNLNLTSAITIEVLVNTDSITGYGEIVCKRDEWAAGEVSYELMRNGNVIRLIIWNTNLKSVNTPSTIIVNRWYHVVATYDGANMIAYLDGNPSSPLANAEGMPVTAADVHIGALSPTPADYFKGKIPLVRIYNRALSAAEIKILYELSYKK